jgi:hypothetical protein
MAISEDGKTLLLTRSSLTQPAELFVAASDGSGLKQVTHANDALLAKLELNTPEKFWYEGAECRESAGDADPAAEIRASKKYPFWCCCTAVRRPCGRHHGATLECTSVLARRAT